MDSPRIEYAVLPADGGPGQDRCFTAEGLVVVLDGASAYDSSVSPDAAAYVDTLGPALIERVSNQPRVDLRTAVAGAIRRTANNLALAPGEGPSSTVSIVRWEGDAIDVLVLGDSPVVIRLKDGATRVMVQHPMSHIAPDLRQLYRDRLAAGQGYDRRHRDILQEIQREEAAVRNQPGGYYIAEAVPDAARHAIVQTFSPSDVVGCILSSDGAEPCLRDVSLDMDSVEVKKLLVGLRNWEHHSDSQGRIRPRSKVHDDKTLALITTSRPAATPPA